MCTPTSGNLRQPNFPLESKGTTQDNNPRQPKTTQDNNPRQPEVTRGNPRHNQPKTQPTQDKQPEIHMLLITFFSSKGYFFAKPTPRHKFFAHYNFYVAKGPFFLSLSLTEKF